MIVNLIEHLYACVGVTSITIRICADFRTYSREFVIAFIDQWRSQECLWKVKTAAYANRNAKALAYDELLLKLKEVEPEATIDFVKKKINALRSNFRCEHNKVQRSKR